VEEGVRRVSVGPEYSKLGEVLGDLARKRNVRGPHRMAKYIRDEVGYGPNGSAWQQIFTGETENPKRAQIKLFPEAFQLSHEEMDRLAWVYAYGAEPPDGG
jgi:hypothetical protein